jgi:outer membrane lipoprotein carrier protein
VLTRALPLGPLVASALALLVACDGPNPAGGSTSGGPPASATTTASAPTAPVSASATVAPLPTTDPEPVHTVAASASAPPADAGPPHDAGAKPPKPVPTAKPDAGAGDAGVAAADAGAAPASPAQLIARKVDAIFAAKKTFNATFAQQYTLKATGAVKDSTGVIFMERPSKISIRYDPPNLQRIVSDGATIKMFMPEESQMYVIPAQNTEYPGALGFMMGNGIATSFDFVINEKAKYGGVVLDGRPLTPTVGYDLVMFYINKELLEKGDPGAIERVLVRDAQGNKNRFDFKGSTQPATIAPAEFTFSPPAGTTIVNR